MGQYVEHNRYAARQLPHLALPLLGELRKHTKLEAQ